MAKKYDREALLADHKTGAFTQRELAHKYKISNSMVAKLTKGVNKDLEPIVSAQVEAKQALATRSIKEVSAVEQEVSKRTQHIQIIRNASLKNIHFMMKKVTEETKHHEHKAVQDTINKAGEALGVIERSGASVNIQNTNAQQTKIDTFDDFYN